jgi:hypothetical protein
MEAITVKPNHDLIAKEVEKCILLIKNNAEQGISATDLYVPKHVSSEIRTELEKQLTASGTDFEFQIVRRSPNEFTGKMQYFTSEILGNTRRYKLQIF